MFNSHSKLSSDLFSNFISYVLKYVVHSSVFSYHRCSNLFLCECSNVSLMFLFFPCVCKLCVLIPFSVSEVLLIRFVLIHILFLLRGLTDYLYCKKFVETSLHFHILSLLFDLSIPLVFSDIITILLLYLLSFQITELYSS